MVFTFHSTTGASDTWTIVVAVATILLALFTAWLAFSTRGLARASVADQRSQWRPILSPGPDGGVGVDHSSDELLLAMTNVGRGPAFGVYTELRNGPDVIGQTPVGAFVTSLQ